MNESCEIFEASLSALVDGELEVPEQLPAIDHLLECPSCQEFYHQARGLGDMVVSSRSQAADPVPEQIWHRIEAESGMSRRGPSRAWAEIRRFPRWSLQLAAVVLLSLGLWWLLPSGVRSPSPPQGEDRRRGDIREASLTEAGTDDVRRSEDGEVDVVLEEDKGTMTDDRFIELATEILKADRSYHRKMFEVMSVVTAMGEAPEGSSDEGDFSVRDSARRISVGEGDEDAASVWAGDRL